MSRVEPTSFAIHVTYTCPLTCKHCCFESSPHNKDRLDFDVIRETIMALDQDKYHLVAFTGGEPMLLGKQLVELVGIASRRGFSTRVVSSVHFAVNDGVALKRLGELREAGLDELSISWDEFHEEFVSFDNVRRATAIGVQLGICVAISATEHESSSWNSERIRRELGSIGDADVSVCDSPLNKTGRAEVELKNKERLASSRLGPCPYVLTGPTLSAKGKLLACCGVVPETSSLVIDDFYSPAHLESAIGKAQKSVLLNWLYVLGPFHLMQKIAQENGMSVPEKGEVAGNCEACRKVLTDPCYTRHLNKTLLANASMVSDYVHTLDAMGSLQGGRPTRLMPA
ncbi:radical SAM protein [Burkholderia sp. B21-007]|uniref:radical SAM protein n=1 Tax=Burkholderia sp. B21-007 TaxID=2890407 RepID=UPI001E5F874E|nr:radical SAM protein [Burkholderia sp. B21-007]UEP27018.1 radical SAM protein [Burkholderia sp. B21-007]